jgi:hypothetical protein
MTSIILLRNVVFMIAPSGCVDAPSRCGDGGWIQGEADPASFPQSRE